MIYVTKLKGETLAINSDLIEFIESTPDTVITLTTGKKIVVLENIDEVINRIKKYKMSICQRCLCNEKLPRKEV